MEIVSSRSEGIGQLSKGRQLYLWDKCKWMELKGEYGWAYEMKLKDKGKLKALREFHPEGLEESVSGAQLWRGVHPERSQRGWW